MDPSIVAKTFRSVLQVAGLPRFRLYDLRHTFATHLLMQGAPITYVAAQLGHTKPTTTLASCNLNGAGGGSRTRDLLITKSGPRVAARCRGLPVVSDSAHLARRASPAVSPCFPPRDCPMIASHGRRHHETRSRCPAAGACGCVSLGSGAVTLRDEGHARWRQELCHPVPPRAPTPSLHDRAPRRAVDAGPGPQRSAAPPRPGGERRGSRGGQASR